MSFPTRPLGEIANVNWGNTSITKASYADIGHPAFSASGSDGLLPTYEFDEKGIVLSAIGARCGRCFRANGKWTAIKNTITIVQKAPNLIEIDYLFHFLNDPTVWIQKGGGQPFISLTDARNVNVPLPPLATQQHIARVLEQADKLRKQAQQMESELNQLAQSLFLEMFGDPVANPYGWKFAPIGEIVRRPLQNGAYYVQEDYADSGVEMAHMSDTFYGVIKRGGMKRVLASNKDVEKYALTKNDVVVTRRSLVYEGSAKPCLVPESEEPLIYESSMIRVSPDLEKLLSVYLFHFLSNPRARESYLFQYVTRSTISGINQTNLAKVKVMLPDLELQHKFARAIELIDKEKALVALECRHLEALFNALMQRAFNGELTAPERKAA